MLIVHRPSCWFSQESTILPLFADASPFTSGMFSGGEYLGQRRKYSYFLEVLYHLIDYANTKNYLHKLDTAKPQKVPLPPDFPGNVGELENEREKAVVMAAVPARHASLICWLCRQA
jgi:hypothetical protein